MDYFKVHTYADKLSPRLSPETLKLAEGNIYALGLKKSDFAKGKTHLDIGANTNGFAAIMNELAKVAPDEFGAFVMGTDPDPMGAPLDPHLINHDWRALNFPSDFEGFDSISSHFGVPLYSGLDWVDERIPDEPDGYVYDFEKPIDHPISRKEGVAHMRRGFERTLSLLKPDGKFVSVPVSSDPDLEETKKFDKAMIGEALDGLRTTFSDLAYRFVEYLDHNRYSERLEVTISNENAERGHGADAMERIFRRYFGPGDLFGTPARKSGLGSGKRVLQVETTTNDLSVAVTGLGRTDPRLGAFVVGTNPDVNADHPRYKRCDVRNLDFPADYEGFNTIVSRNGFPMSILKWLDRNKQDAKDSVGQTYDFTKPISGPISIEEAAAHVEQGFSEMLRWLKPEGEIRCDSDVGFEQYYDIIKVALENLQRKHHNEHPYMKFGLTGGGMLIVMQDGREKK